MDPDQADCTLVQLPAELIQAILSHLDPPDLGTVAQTCRRLAVASYDDQVWHPLVDAQLPRPIPSPTPCKTFRDLYLAHRPYWFLVRNQVWFGDAEPNGKLIVTRYDPTHGRIEAHAVAATRGEDLLTFWEKDRNVIIHSFTPDVRLDLRSPVLQLNVDSPSIPVTPSPSVSASSGGITPSPPPFTSRPLSHEILMSTLSEERLYSSLLLTRALPGPAIFDNTLVWPPVRVPSPARTRNDTHDHYRTAGHRPVRLRDLSESTFRIRRWVEYSPRLPTPRTTITTADNPHPRTFIDPVFDPSRISIYPPETLARIPGFASALRMGVVGGPGAGIGRNPGFRPPEFVTTFAAVPAEARTPTREKPWQGVWCGDYSGHGCEFLLITQPDPKDARPLPEGMGWLRAWFNGTGGQQHQQQQHGASRRRGSEGSEGSFVSAVEEMGVGGEDDAEEMGEGGEGAGEGDAAEGGWDGLMMPPPGQFVRFPVPEANARDYSDVPTGRLEAIKLTGDPNVPRGEYTFIAPEIGHEGFLRVADEETFRGARVVRSAGHIAGRGFVQDQYTPSQLIMVSHDELAQFWEGFGHISYYKRVDLDALLDSHA